MKKRIIIENQGNNIETEAEFSNDPAAKKLVEKMPIASIVRLWGEEIYFDTGINAPPDGATMDINSGDIAYWPAGKCLCLFFGPTPASTTSKPVPASEVVIVGKITSNISILKQAKSGSKIRVE